MCNKYNWPGPAISFCQKVLCFLARLFVLFLFCCSLVIVVACCRAMQRVTVIKGSNCTKITTVFLQVLRSTVVVRLNCRAQ